MANIRPTRNRAAADKADHRAGKLVENLELQHMPAQFVAVEELEAGLSIDKDALDMSLHEQPDLYYRVSQALTFALSRRDAASQFLKETMADQDAKIRHAAAVSDERITEKEVESQKLLSKEVRKAQDDYHLWNTRCGQYQALKEAFGQRSYVLRELVQLWLAGYFGDAVEKRRNSDVRTRLGEEAREARGKDYRGTR